MKRMSRKHNEYVEIESIDNFIDEIEEICKKYNLSISHEDEHGSFLVEKYKDSTMRWLKESDINIGD